MSPDSRRSSAAVRTASRLVVCITVILMTITGCRPSSGGQSVGLAERPEFPRPAQNGSVSPSAERPRITSRPTPATPSPPSLQLLGTWQTLEGTGFDVVLTGARASEIAGVEMASDDCVYQSQKSTQTVRAFRCLAPWIGPTEERTDFARVTYNTGAPATSIGGFVFRNQASWRQYNGEYYMQSLWNYLLNASASQGPTINLEPRALPGYTGDPTMVDQAAGFNAVRLWGRDGPIICNTAGYFEYKCPVVPEGIYSFEILFEQGTRYIAGNTFTVKVVYGSLDAPAPQTGNNPGTSNPPVTAPPCDPNVTKGC